MHTYKGYQIPDRGDKEWTEMMHLFMHDIIDAKTNPVNSGDVYCTNITPTLTGNIYDKTYIDGIVLNGFQSTTTTITVYVTAISGGSRLKPEVTVNSIAITNFSATTSPDVWTGSVSITLDASGLVSIRHIDGASYSLSGILTYAPIITSAVFTGGYPSTQTELKAGDVYNIQVNANTQFTKIEIADYGAYIYSLVNVSASNSTIISGTIATRTNVATSYGAKVRIYDVNNTASDWVYTNTLASVDGINVVVLNNIVPVISITGITYPNTQSAIKTTETASFTLNITNYTSFNVTSPTSELNVSGVTVGSTNASCIGGTYNVNTPNIRITASRTNNGSTSTYTSTINIATIAPVITVTQPYTRLKSGGSFGTSVQNYTITLSSNQLLYSTPTMNLSAGSGTWGNAFTGSGASWTRVMQVSDSDTKGTFAYTSINAVGISGISATTITTGASYTLGGFIRRIITIDAWPNRSSAIGTSVVNTTKLLCTNLSKGASGSYNYSYIATQTDTVNGYTIANTNSLYNCDLLNAVSNSGGLTQIEIEEVV